MSSRLVQVGTLTPEKRIEIMNVWLRSAKRVLSATQTKVSANDLLLIENNHLTFT